MIINGKDVDHYFASFSAIQIASVVQVLEVFGLHRELELYLKNGIFKKKYKPAPFIPPDPLDGRMQTLSRPCPKCGNRLVGTDKVGCAGRKWYEECTICDYYREEFGGR